jgi:hypothetical protein
MMSDRLHWSYRELCCFEQRIRESFCEYQIFSLVASSCLCPSCFEAAVVGQLTVEHFLPIYQYALRSKEDDRILFLA